MVRRLFKRATYFSAAELSVLSFIILSLIRGALLWYTERNRVVHSFVPIHRQVQVVPVNPSKDLTIPSGIETHTALKPVQYKGETFVDMWFNAISAVCVTGLTTSDFSQFTLGGQIITLLLIQIGGLGVIVFTSFIAFAVFKGLSERASVRKVLASVMDTEHQDVLDMLKYVFFYTFLFEGAGILIMGFHLQTLADPSVLKGINPWWWATFHSISAFNNAGFSLIQDNLMSFVTDPVINITIALLIILGGLGYPVLIAIYMWMRTMAKKNGLTQLKLQHNFSGVASPVQVRIALYNTIGLLLAGTVIPLIVESGSAWASKYTLSQNILIHFFQSASTRTAGFNTIDVGALHVTTLFLYMLLMFIGANPAGTAGGIKIPTVAVLYGYIKDWFKKPGEPVMLFGRRISKFAVSHAIRLFFFSTIFIAVITFAICYIERDYLITPDPLFNFTKVLFEIFSAFGTVGLTMGYTGGVTSFSGILSPASKVLLIIVMLFGRVGALTILAALPWKRRHADAPLTEDFPDSYKIQIG
jgi:trk system potassium uptake protein TrkH